MIIFFNKSRLCLISKKHGSPLDVYSFLVVKSHLYVWYDTLRCLGIELVPPHGILGLFEGFLGMGKSMKDRMCGC
jgi:hypothetical protein